MDLLLDAATSTLNGDQLAHARLLTTHEQGLACEPGAVSSDGRCPWLARQGALSTQSGGVLVAWGIAGAASMPRHEKAALPVLMNRAGTMRSDRSAAPRAARSWSSSFHHCWDIWGQFLLGC